MKKNVILSLVLLMFVVTYSYSQEQKKPDTKTPETGAKSETRAELPEITTEGNVYREITVMDFENIDFKESDIVFQKTRDEEYKVAVRDETPAPLNSKKYLGVKLRGTKSNAIQIKFPKDKIPTIDKYVQSISIWIYGKQFTGEFSLFVMDASGRTHRLSFGKLNFHGWHKLTKILPTEVNQGENLLEQKSNIKILSMLYVPGTWFKPGTNIIDPTWQTFYVDDITAKVREKYVDNQNDEW
jgi:hypothetical protein